MKLIFAKVEHAGSFQVARLGARSHVLLFGKNGSGKSLLLDSILRGLRYETIEGKFRNTNSLLPTLQTPEEDVSQVVSNYPSRATVSLYFEVAGDIALFSPEFWVLEALFPPGGLWVLGPTIPGIEPSAAKRIVLSPPTPYEPEALKPLSDLLNAGLCIELKRTNEDWALIQLLRAMTDDEREILSARWGNDVEFSLCTKLSPSQLDHAIELLTLLPQPLLNSIQSIATPLLQARNEAYEDGQPIIIVFSKLSAPERQLGQRDDDIKDLFKRIIPTPLRLTEADADLATTVEFAIGEIAHKLTRDWLGSTEYESSCQLSEISQDAVRWITITTEDEDLLDEDGFRNLQLNPAIAEAATRLEQRWIENLPSFVGEQGIPLLEILPPTKWAETRQRISLSFIEGGVSVPIERTSSGLKKWLHLSLLMACQDLLSARRVFDVFVYPDGYPEPSEVDEIISEVRTDPTQFSAIGLDCSHSNYVVALDEPEAHLHPTAIKSIREWIDFTSPRISALFVATHSPELCRTSNPDAQRLVVVKDAAGSRIIRWEDLFNFEVDWLHEVGMSEADLLLTSRYFLFVEGPHDVIVFEGLFGQRLDDLGIKIFPLHGLKRGMSTFADAEFVRLLGTPLGVMADNSDGETKSWESKEMDRLASELKNSGKVPDFWRLGKPDILDYLPISMVLKAPMNSLFGTWEQARLAHHEWMIESKGHTDDFKLWLKKKFEVDLNRETIHKIVRVVKISAQIPEELIRIVDGIEAKINRGFK